MIVGLQNLCAARRAHARASISVAISQIILTSSTQSLINNVSLFISSSSLYSLVISSSILCFWAYR